MGRVLIVLAFMCLAVAVMGSEIYAQGDTHCGPTTECKYGTHCCSPVTCCPDYSYCCGTGRECCRLANSLDAPEKFPATAAMVV